ncbi:hypothetical protein NECAME_17341, partial [Necator americanus]
SWFEEDKESKHFILKTNAVGSMCYQQLWRLVIKYPTFDCPRLCKFTATHFKRDGIAGSSE